MNTALDYMVCSFVRLSDAALPTVPGVHSAPGELLYNSYGIILCARRDVGDEILGVVKVMSKAYGWSRMCMRGA